jgi:peptidyl-tRNA hydrolase, PTH1 family
MKIIACLGNPGKKYRNNRHNIGFILGEMLARQYGITFGKKEFGAQTGAGRIADERCLLVFPQTFMNLSGQAVQAALAYHEESAGNLIVIHDEIELPFGTFRTKFGGGHKGHNGIRSIMQLVGTGDFHRLRVGVGRPENPEMQVADYVLSDFTHEEMGTIESIFPRVLEEVVALVDNKAPDEQKGD